MFFSLTIILSSPYGYIKICLGDLILTNDSKFIGSRESHFALGTILENE